MTAGAYGAVMSSTYNARALVPEVLVHGDRFRDRAQALGAEGSAGAGTHSGLGLKDDAKSDALRRLRFPLAQAHRRHRRRMRSSPTSRRCAATHMRAVLSPRTRRMRTSPASRW
jgi:hypothetical protein